MQNWIYDSIEKEFVEYAKMMQILINKIKENDKLNESNFVLVGNTCIVISILLKNKLHLVKDFETIRKFYFVITIQKIHNNDVVHRFATKCLIRILDKEEIKD
ncbi:MAG: hypothetical protein IPQ19_15330 [Bacteroidetes bacterium]|nr:hypothetical protein [Bacteroidota bacterium]